MKVLLTGGCGFIGSHVQDKYIEKGYDVIVVDNLSSGKKEYLNPKARLYETDIRDREKLEKIFNKEKPDIVNHHAAQISVIHSVENPFEDAKINIIGSLNLIELSVKYNIKKFIYASSGGAAYGNPVKNPCDEGHPVNPLSPYGVSKHTVEHYLYLYRVNYGLEYVILRYPNVYGPRQDPFGEAGVVAIFTERMLKNDDVYIFGDGTQERDFVYVEDIAEANILVTEREIDEDFPIYNLGSGKGISVNEIFNYLKDITGYKKAPHYKPPRKGEVYKIALDARRIKNLGWAPKVNLKEGLEKTAEWFRNINI